jgi:hypothetical protein
VAVALWNMTADGAELLNLAVAAGLRGQGSRQAVALVAEDASRSGAVRHWRQPPFRQTYSFLLKQE